LARYGLQGLIELEVAAFLGADRHERTEERLGHRNGYRPRTLTTQVGDLALQIPKLRAGSFLPSILEPRRRVDQALYAVIMEAYIGGVSTRKVDALVGALGSQSGISSGGSTAQPCFAATNGGHHHPGHRQGSAGQAAHDGQ
jgi:putative transposase